MTIFGQNVFQATCKAHFSNLPSYVHHRVRKLVEFPCPSSSISWENGNVGSSCSRYHQYYAQSCRNVTHDIRNLWINIVDYHMPDNGKITSLIVATMQTIRNIQFIL